MNANSNSSAIRSETMPLDQFLTAFPTLIGDIYGSDLEDGPTVEPLKRDLFKNEGWQCLILPGQIGNLDKSHRLDEPESIESERTFWRPVNWLEAILMAHWTRPEPHILQAYTAVFGRRWKPDQSECVVCRVPAVASDLAAAGRPPTSPHWSEMLFDPRGEWGMIDVFDEPMTLLGAKGDLFDRFAELFGGLDEIMLCFNEYLCNLEVRNRKTSPDGKPINEEFLSNYRPIYDRIGWPWPFPDHIGKEP